MTNERPALQKLSSPVPSQVSLRDGNTLPIFWCNTAHLLLLHLPKPTPPWPHEPAGLAWKDLYTYTSLLINRQVTRVNFRGLLCCFGLPIVPSSLNCVRAPLLF